jgi:rhodanese-related sulfurtransferase
MSQQSDTEQLTPRQTPGWVLPAVIIGAVVLVAALVSVALTMREVPRPAAVAPTAAAGIAAAPDAATAAAGQAVPPTHGSLDPNGPKVDLIGVAEARAKLDAGEAVFIDVRAGSDYAAGHIPGALTITANNLDATIAGLPAGAVIIAYGDASRPDSGQRGAQIFMDLGYPKVIALEGGFQGWQQAGNPVDTQP